MTRAIYLCLPPGAERLDHAKWCTSENNRRPVYSISKPAGQLVRARETERSPAMIGILLHSAAGWRCRALREGCARIRAFFITANLTVFAKNCNRTSRSPRGNVRGMTPDEGGRRFDSSGWAASSRADREARGSGPRYPPADLRFA